MDPKRDEKLRAKAVVRLTVEIESGAWGSDCSMTQVYDQAAREAVERVRQHFKDQVRIVGEPEVTAVLVRKP